MKYDYDVAIIGGGPCGTAAAIYLKQAGYRCCIIENEIIGGQPTYTTQISNLVGFQGTGEDLANIMQEQLDKLKIDIIYGKLEHLRYKFGTVKHILIKGNHITARVVVIATGARPKTIEDLNSNNVHYCGLCDGALYRDKEVVIIGGGNSAFTEGLYLSNICKKVTILGLEEHNFNPNEDLFRRFVSKDNCECELYTSYIYNETSKVFTIWNDNENTVTDINADGIFISIGREANAEFIQCNKKNGCIVVDKHFRVKDNNHIIKGIYAGGDVINKPIKQISTAIADGVHISQEVIEFLRSLKYGN